MLKNKMYGWYLSPDKGTGGSDGTAADDGTSAVTKNSDNSHMIPKTRFDEVNNRSKELEKELAAVKEALNKAQTSRLEEQEQYKELYEKTASELSEIKPIAEQISVYKKTVGTLLEAQVAEIPEEMRSLIPEELGDVQKLNWIARNRTLLMKPAGPDIGAGNRGSGSSTGTEITPEEKEVANAFGITAEEYLKYSDNTQPTK
jgi:ribonucleoside-triphosphate reductase